MATESNLGKIHIFPSEASYNTNKTDVAANDLAFVPTPRIPIETYRDGNQWYVKYSDGWCEQGDRIVMTLARDSQDKPVNFQVPFKSDGQLCVMAMPLRDTTSSTSLVRNATGCSSFTNTGVVLRTYGAAASGDGATALIWYACGYYK